MHTHLPITNPYSNTNAPVSLLKYADTPHPTPSPHTHTPHSHLSLNHPTTQIVSCSNTRAWMCVCVRAHLFVCVRLQGCGQKKREMKRWMREMRREEDKGRERGSLTNLNWRQTWFYDACQFIQTSCWNMPLSHPSAGDTAVVGICSQRTHANRAVLPQLE